MLALPKKKLAVLQLAFLFFAPHGLSQEWQKGEIHHVFNGIDVAPALTVIQEKNISPYDFGSDLFYAGAKRKAMQWYTLMGKRTNDLQYIYGLAWMRLASGEFKDAIRDAEYVLGGKPSPLIRARCLLLLGTIRGLEHKFQSAETLLNEGYDLYGELNKIGGQHLCKVELARVAVGRKDYDAVEPLLKEAWDLNLKSISLGYRSQGMGKIFEVRAESQLGQGNFKDSLDYFQLSHHALLEMGMKGDAQLVEPRIALLQLLTGFPSKAYQLCEEIWNKHHDQEGTDEIMAGYSIVMMKLSLCGQRFEDAERHELHATAWAKNNLGGERMLEILTALKDGRKSPCPKWR